MRQVVFETERLIVRHFDAADRDDFFNINGDPEIMRFIRPAKDRASCDLFLKEIIALNQDGFCLNRFAVQEKISGQFAGSFALIPVAGTDQIQLGYALVKSCWGRGFATELARAGAEYFFQETDRDHLAAITQAGNQASIRVLLASGFQEDHRYFEDGHTLIFFTKNR